MISIVICSKKKSISSDLLLNIKNTIGCSYELIIIDNASNQYSIFEAYNIGIKKSRGAYWCFIHDDILFHSQDWGGKVKSIFENNLQIGLIGIAGSKIKTKMPSAWWDCPHELMVVHVIHQLNNSEIEVQNHGFEDSDCVEVSVIDGVFMAGRVVKTIVFDESLKGFHHYDLFLCLQYLQLNLKVVVTNQVEIEHSSVGSLNSSWVQSALIFDRKYSKMLPLGSQFYEKKIKFNVVEFQNGILFLNKLMEFNLRESAFFIWLRLVKIKPFSKLHFNFFKYFINNG